jgi:hypothetical protein
MMGRHAIAGDHMRKLRTVWCVSAAGSVSGETGGRYDAGSQFTQGGVP